MSTLADRSADDHNDDLTRDRDEIARILVAGLAHDLHNQLGTILMTVGFTAGGGDQQAGRTGSALKMAKLAERSVEKAMALCDRIRQLPDIFTGEPMAVDTRHLVVGIEKKARTELADGVKLLAKEDIIPQGAEEIRAHLDNLTKNLQSGSNPRATAAMASLAESIQGLVQHMRADHQVMKDQLKSQQAQQKQVAELMTKLNRFFERAAKS